MKIIDYTFRQNVKTRSLFQDCIQVHFVGTDGLDFIQNYNASLLPGNHFGQFLRKMFEENTVSCSLFDDDDELEETDVETISDAEDMISE